MRRLAPIAVLMLVAACGGDVSGESTTTVPPTSAPESTTPSDTTTTTLATTTTTEAVGTTTTTEAAALFVHIEVVISGDTVTVTVDGAPLDGRVMVERGQLVTIDFESDVAEELHVHGYDILVTAEPGNPGSAEFTAEIPGIFEVERHFAGHIHIFSVQVA